MLKRSPVTTMKKHSIIQSKQGCKCKKGYTFDFSRDARPATLACTNGSRPQGRRRLKCKGPAAKKHNNHWPSSKYTMSASVIAKVSSVDFVRNFLARLRYV
eukprot:scaffold45042_cov18-Tisochrysis_lutea.AAC.1